MESSRDSRGKAITLRGLSRSTGFSYEHVRRVLGGDPVASRRFNAAIAKALGLDEEAMWQVAQRDKLARKYGQPAVPYNATGALGEGELPAKLIQLWRQLTAQDRARVLAIIEGLAAAAAMESTLGLHKT